MNDIILLDKTGHGLTESQIEAALGEFLSQLPKSEKTLIIPPDYSRMHSGAGLLSQMLYRQMPDTHVDLLPALGTHEAVSDVQRKIFFGEEIPKDRYIVHHWKDEVVKIGEVPAEFVNEVSEGIMNEPFDVEVNHHLIDGGYDRILSVGQVVPHEVIGLANYTKNILVGVGGSGFINKSHMLGALYGMERIMGRDNTPVRKVFDYAQEKYLNNLPLYYILTVTTADEEGVHIHGLFIGNRRSVFENAAKLAQQTNLTFIDKPFKKCVVWLDEEEFQSTWLGNKAVYRTRMAMADGGELIILAPGVRHFGEDEGIDVLIREFGYVGRQKILELYRSNEKLRCNQSVAAHLVHGSSDGRFSVCYATQHLTKEEVEGVGFNYMPLAEAMEKYNPKTLKNGYNMVDGEEIFFIENPAIGLWADKSKF